MLGVSRKPLSHQGRATTIVTLFNKLIRIFPRIHRTFERPIFSYHVVESILMFLHCCVKLIMAILTYSYRDVSLIINMMN